MHWSRLFAASLLAGLVLLAVSCANSADANKPPTTLAKSPAPASPAPSEALEIPADLRQTPIATTKPGSLAPPELVIIDIIEGTGPEAKRGDFVVVNYVGSLLTDGAEFDSSWRRNQPFDFRLGRGNVIPGWDQGIVGMKVGGRRELVIPAPMAYGERGAGDTIPPDAALVFVVDLLAVQS